MSRKYKFYNGKGLYFVSFATVYWLDVYVREEYCEVLVQSLKHCQKEKGMEIFAWCIMPSHVHLIFCATQHNPSDLLRDFKKYTSRELQKVIGTNPVESRKEWLLWMIKRAGSKNCNVKVYQFWQQHNKPIELWSNAVIDQKVEYIHNNPVEADFVNEPQHWKYSSANENQLIKLAVL